MPQATFMIKPVSNLCNMQCQYCFYDDVSKNRKQASHGIMSAETLETIVKKALEYADTSCSFAFQGGEPTLAGLDFYKSLLNFQKIYNKKNIAINNSIQTNGLNLNAQWANFFAKNKFLVGLSIDGTQPLHDKHRKTANGAGTYDKIQKTASIFQGHKVEYNILCVVNNDVACAPEDVYLNLKKHKYLQFIPCINYFDENSPTLNVAAYANFLKITFDLYYKDFMRGKYVSIRNFDNYINVLSGNPPEQCGMAGMCSRYFLIEADGGVFPCDFYVLDEWKIGNINEDSLFRMIKSEASHLFINSSKHVDEKCTKCKWHGLCRGGCRRYREPMVNNTLSLNSNCEAFNDFFEYSYSRMVEIAKMALSPSL